MVKIKIWIRWNVREDERAIEKVKMKLNNRLFGYSILKYCFFKVFNTVVVLKYGQILI